MSQNRIDEVEKYYQSVELTGKISASLFWICAVLSLVILYSGSFPEAMSSWLSVVFITSVIIRFGVSLYNSTILMPNADSERRKQLLSDAFDTPLTTAQTTGYYNNALPPSAIRLAASLFENAHFGKDICQRMARKEWAKVCTYFLIWLVAITYRDTDLGLIAALTQFLFCGEVLAQAVRLQVLRYRIGRVYDNLYDLFLHGISPDQNRGIANLLGVFVSYECAKAAASIKQSSKIFAEQNSQLSRSWESTRAQLGMDDMPSK